MLKGKTLYERSEFVLPKEFPLSEKPASTALIFCVLFYQEKSTKRRRHPRRSLGKLCNIKGNGLALVILSLSKGISEKNDRPFPLAGKVSAQLTERVVRPTKAYACHPAPFKEISEKNDRPFPLAGKVAAQLTERVVRFAFSNLALSPHAPYFYKLNVTAAAQHRKR